MAAPCPVREPHTAYTRRNILYIDVVVDGVTAQRNVTNSNVSVFYFRARWGRDLTEAKLTDWLTILIFVPPGLYGCVID
jgi:hypothetical protein